MKVGSTSSIPFLFLINAILAEAVDLCVKEGFIPDVYYNGSLRINHPLHRNDFWNWHQLHVQAEISPSPDCI